MGSTQDGSCLACKYETNVKVTDTDEHSSLPHYGIHYAHKRFYSADPWGLYHKTYYGRNLRISGIS